ncbi:MAG: polysaccharide lyase family protein, partial [Terriglobia bacterium]
MPRRLDLGILAFIVLAFAACLPASTATVWQIGQFDQTSREFNQSAPFGNSTYNPVFIAGQSVAKDWPARQPGSENPSEGLRPHPFTILFNLNARPRGTYRFEISAILD